MCLYCLMQNISLIVGLIKGFEYLLSVFCSKWIYIRPLGQVTLPCSHRMCRISCDLWPQLNEISILGKYLLIQPADGVVKPGPQKYCCNFDGLFNTFFRFKKVYFMRPNADQSIYVAIWDHLRSMGGITSFGRLKVVLYLRKKGLKIHQNGNSGWTATVTTSCYGYKLFCSLFQENMSGHYIYFISFPWHIIPRIQ